MGKKDATLVKLGKNLRAARAAKGWSQEELAHKCCVHRTYVGAVERGEYNVTILTLKKITKTLGMAMKDVVRGF